ncbi:MAG TPA: outer membrane beta-barrel protein [Burkholderiales bacterium]|nr:outer membrane beta-barrel protein [Burkholderiales bacterium]
MKKLTQALITASLLSISALVLADEPTAPAKPKVPVPALQDVLDAWGLTLNGYIDVSYSYLSGNGFFTSGTPGVNGTPDRVFDNQHSAFTVHQAAFTLAKQPKEGFGGLVNVTAGEDADVIAPYNQNPGSTSKFDLTQAYVQYGWKQLTAIGGKFVTLAGAEVINPTADVNFSRSILFGYAIPFTHTGVRGTYAVNDALSLILGLNNGWDDLQDTNGNKTIEAGATYAPTKSLSFSAAGYFGNEKLCGSSCGGTGQPSAQNSPGGYRGLVDLIGTFNATDKLAFTLNYDFGWQDNAGAPNLANGGAPFDADGNGVATWNGIAGYGSYQFTDQWRGVVRLEYFDDKDGYRTGVKQQWKEMTYTLAYLPTSNFEMRAEYRYDWSNGHAPFPNGPLNAFMTSNGIGTSKQQYSFGLEALLKF